MYNIQFTLFCLLFTSTFSLTAQQTDTLYYDGFDDPTVWDMQGSTANSNIWIINNVYQGGSVSGFINVPNVPAQPADIQNPNGNYLHPLNTNLAQPSGVNNANYLLGFGGSQIDAVMTTSVSTTDHENVTVSFFRTGGINGLSLIYSTNGGMTWTVAAELSGAPSTWTQEFYQLPDFDGQADFKIGFRFNDNAAGDPAPLHYHSIDDVRIKGEPATGPSTTISAESDAQSYCNGDVIEVTFTVDGDIDPGNTFTAELSDENGSFANPFTIGTLSGTTGGTITGVIPSAAVSGSGYSVRVNSSAPPVEGDPSVQIITINPTPDVTLSPSAFAVCPGDTVSLTAGGADSYVWSPAGELLSSSGNEATVIVESEITVSVTGTSAGCSDDANVTLNIFPLQTQPVIQLEAGTLVVDNPGTPVIQWYLDGEPIPGAESETFTPEVEGVYTVVFTNKEGCEIVSEPFDYILIGLYQTTQPNTTRLYPNPTSDFIMIENADNFEYLFVYTVHGALVYEQKIMKNNTLIQISELGLESATYLILLKSSSGKTDSHIMTINKF